MSLAEDIKKYVPTNEQEANDKKQMLQFINDFQNYLERENQVGHFTASMWVVNKERTKTLMIYHNIYNAWSWIGGHADGMEDLCEVACKEFFTASMWVVNKERTKTLMIYHNIYNAWSWIGGHADGMEDLCEVACKELQEETGIKNIHLVSRDIFSIETIPVNGHVKKGRWVPSHLHFNVTYLAEADEEEELFVKVDENSGVSWWSNEEALKMSTELWMVENVYKKLMEKSRHM